MSRTYEDVERDKTLEKISHKLGEIESNTRPPRGPPDIFAIGSLFRPLRRSISDTTNCVLDIAFTMICITGGIGLFYPFFADSGDFYTAKIFVYSILMFIVGGIGMASSPVHDKKR